MVEKKYSPKGLQRFLEFASQEGDGDQVREMIEALYFFGVARKLFPSQLEENERSCVLCILEDFDNNLLTKKLRLCVELWYSTAVEEKLYEPAVSDVTTDSDASINSGPDWNIANSIYREVVRYTCMKGRCLDLDNDKLADILNRIFTNRKAMISAVMQAMEPPIDQVSDELRELKVVVNRNHDTGDGMRSVDSDNSDWMTLQAFATNYCLKLCGSNAVDSEKISNYCLKNQEGGGGG